MTLYIPVFHLIILNFKSKPHSMGCIRISSFLFLHLNKFYSLNINYMPGRLKIKSQMPLTYIELEFKSRTKGTNFTLLQILEVLGRWVWLKTWEKFFFGNLNSERSMVWFRQIFAVKLRLLLKAETLYAYLESDQLVWIRRMV